MAPQEFGILESFGINACDTKQNRFGNIFLLLEIHILCKLRHCVEQNIILKWIFIFSEIRALSRMSDD